MYGLCFEPKNKITVGRGTLKLTSACSLSYSLPETRGRRMPVGCADPSSLFPFSPFSPLDSLNRWRGDQVSPPPGADRESRKWCADRIVGRSTSWSPGEIRVKRSLRPQDKLELLEGSWDPTQGRACPGLRRVRASGGGASADGTAGSKGSNSPGL